MPYGLLLMYAILIVAGVSILHWSGPASRASDVLTRQLSKQFPALNKFRWTSEEFNLKHSRTCVRASGALLFAAGSSCMLGIVLTLLLVRFHYLPSQYFILRYVFVFCFEMFAILFVAAFLCSRPDLARPNEIKDTANKD